MKTEQLFNLENIDPEDSDACIVSIARSLNLHVEPADFLQVQTFGDLCDVFLSKIPGTEKGCTSQQAFYKLRSFLSSITPHDILPATRLADIIPAAQLWHTERALRQQLNCKLQVTRIKSSAMYILSAGYGIGLLFFFYHYTFALGILAAVFLFNLVAARWILAPAFNTVGDLARELKLRHYSMARRHPGSVNRQEIIKLIEDTFIDKTDIDRGALMREARL